MSEPTTLQLLQAAINSMVEMESKLESVVARVSALESQVEAEKVPDISLRVKIARIVKLFCLEDRDFEEAYKFLYRQFKDRYHIDLHQRSVNQGVSALQIAETMELLEPLHALAHSMFIENAEKYRNAFRKAPTQEAPDFIGSIINSIQRAKGGSLNWEYVAQVSDMWDYLYQYSNHEPWPNSASLFGKYLRAAAERLHKLGFEVFFRKSDVRFARIVSSRPVTSSLMVFSK